MKRLHIYLLSFCLFACSCKQHPSQSANEKNILGDWVEVRNPSRGAQVLEPIRFGREGLSFYKDFTLEKKTGYVNYKNKVDRYLGTRSKYQITRDSLNLFDLVENKWDKYEIIKLTKDSLQFDWDNDLITFKHYKTPKYDIPDFDKIVLATSGCFGPCPIISIEVNKNGDILFRSFAYTERIGIYTGKINPKVYQNLQNGFSKVDFNLLKNSYSTGVTDMETISITFEKNNKIIKTVNDYGRSAPTFFMWNYPQLRYLYQQIKLNEVIKEDFIPGFKNVTSSAFQKKDEAVKLTQSETTLLVSHLWNGKHTATPFKKRFKLRIGGDFFSHTDIDTDGRYYTFNKKSKTVTIDIGFNFYDVNVNHWQWRNMTELQ